MRMRVVAGKRTFPLVNRRRSAAFIFNSEPVNGVLAKHIKNCARV